MHERIVVLEKALDEMRAALEHARIGGYRSMCDTRRCPACGSGSLFHVRRAPEVGKKGLEPLALQHTKGFFGFTTNGPIEYFVCRNCRLIESHVIDFEGVHADGEHILAIEPEPDPAAPSDGPFR